MFPRTLPSRFTGRCLLAAMLLAPFLSLPDAHAAHFTFLQPGFTQEVYGVSNDFHGGVAFAPDGDVWVNFCQFSGSGMHRFDRQSTIIVNATTIHPHTTVSSNAGCGMTNHPNGSIYTNTSLGVIKLDANTGAQTGGGFGPGGNALGITPDPQTGNLVYVGSEGTMRFVDANLAVSGTFSIVTAGNFVDGIYFDPSGNFLFCANRSPSFRLTIIRRNGTLVQHVPMSTEPDGIAFRAASPKFVVTNNTDGTMTRFDFPGDDFTQVPVQSVFASGGFRGDLSQVGSDGCLYLTQDGTRYDNGTTTFENSVIRICPGFAPPVTNLTLSPPNATNFTNTTHTVTARVTNAGGAPVVGALVVFTVVSGPNTGTTGTCSTNGDCTTDSNGEVSWTYLGDGGVGIDEIRASYTDDSGFEQEARVNKEWIPNPNERPVCDDAHASIDELWPPNHMMVPVQILGVYDPDDDPVTIVITGVRQDEPVDAIGDGHTCPDAVIGVGPNVEVRAERSGSKQNGGNGRVYHIFFTATDPEGESCSGEVTVCVPHDQGGGGGSGESPEEIVRRGHVPEGGGGGHSSCADDGPLHNSLGPCDNGNGRGHLEAGDLSIRSTMPGDVLFEYALDAEDDVVLGIYDITGRRMAMLESGRRSSGQHQLTWNTGGVPNGVYFSRLQTSHGIVTRTVMVVR